MQRQTPHLLADRRQMQRIADRGLRMADLDQAETAKQRQCRVERVLARPLEPLQRARIAAPGDHVQRRARQVDAMDLRLAVRAQPIARVPQPPHDARRQPPGAARPLVRGVPGDALGLEAVDAAFRVVARDLLQPGVDHRGHAGHGQRRLGDVRGDDDAAAQRRAQGQVLLVGVERSVQRDDLDAAAGLVLQLGDRAPDLRRARQEAEHLPVARREQIDRRIGDRLPGVMRDRDRMRPARDVDHRAAVEKRRHRLRLQRRRHHDDAQVVARAPGLTREREREIGVDAALVKLVEHDRREVAEQRIALQAGGQDAFGDDEQPRVRAEAALEPDLPADLAAKGPAALACDPRRDRARRDPPRLQQDHPAVGQQRRRHTGRLAGAWGRGDHRGARTADAIDDLIEERIDRERNQLTHSLQRRSGS